MKNSIKIILLLLMTMFFSCEESIGFDDCADCLLEDPVRGKLEFRLDFTYGVPVNVKIYEGELCDSIMIYSFNINSGSHTYNVWINNMFTATASYRIRQRKFVVVDTAFPKAKLDEEHCVDPCYFIYDNVLDLRLKYAD